MGFTTHSFTQPSSRKSTSPTIQNLSSSAVEVHWNGASGLAALAPPALAAAEPAPDLEAGRRTFESVCAACHGPTGRPDPENPTVKALDPQPADLSDPLFNSREPAEDWQIVVTHGGQALGLSAPTRR